MSSDYSRLHPFLVLCVRPYVTDARGPSLRHGQKIIHYYLVLLTSACASAIRELCFLLEVLAFYHGMR